MKIYDFEIDHQREALGLTNPFPRFSWKIMSENENTLQMSYQLRLWQERNLLWDTGEVQSRDSVLIPYAGDALAPETEYIAVLTVRDSYRECNQAELFFETGIMDPSSFRAQMITHDLPEGEEACPVFTKQFSIGKKVAKARAYLTAQGLYEAKINGEKIGEDCLTPGWTSYRHRLMYQVYDITQEISEENCLSITLAKGWFSGIVGYALKNHHYGDRNAVFAELHIFYEDGSCEIIKTDETWHVRTGEVRSTELYMGEVIDSFDAPVLEGRVMPVLDFDPSILCLQENEPIRITERIPAKEIFRDTAGNLVVDFGQNLSGVAELSVCGRPGQKIVLRHAETLDKNGVFYTENLRHAKAMDVFVCNGNEQTFRPKFTFHGFRYIAVEGLDDVKKEQITACVMHSDMRRIGHFHCSNDKVNQLYSNATWSQRDNFVDVPTDCPQRDERLGWTGDAQVFSWTASEQFDTARFFAKWMRDVAAESSLEMGVPHVVPNIIDSYSAAGWSDAAVIIPWVVYQIYGDDMVLKESWKTMHEWVDYVHAHCNKNGLWMTGYQFGDWLAMDREEGPRNVGATDVGYVSNAFYLHSMELVSKTAAVLGFAEESERYRKCYEETLVSFRKEYFTPRGRIIAETQTGCVLALAFGLCEEKYRNQILSTLAENIRLHKNHLTTGFLGTPYICHVLTENGYHDLAASIFMKEDYPSWLYSVNMGATTIWERWNSIAPDGSFDESGMNSLNHYAYGSIVDWMYRKLCGIEQTEPGYRKIRIEPHFVKGIEEASASIDTPYGTVSVSYSCRDGKITIKAEVPANTTAELVLPEMDQVISIGSGSYIYSYDTETNLMPDRFTNENTLNDIFKIPGVEEMLLSALPQLKADPQFEIARTLPISTIMEVAPECTPALEKLLKQVNR